MASPILSAQWPRTLERPHWSDHAAGPDESRWPEAWDKCVGLWVPGLGFQGNMSFNGLVDLSGYQNHGTYQNTPVHIINDAGYVLEAGTGSGSDDRRCKFLDKVQYDFADKQFTVAVWVKNKKAAIGATGKEYIVEKEGAGSDSFAVAWEANEDVTFRLNATTLTWGTGIESGQGDKWHFIVCTYDGANKRIWIDGVNGASAAETAAINVTAHNILWGSATSNASWDGYMAFFGLWNRCLQRGDISRMYAAPFAMLMPVAISSVGKASITLTPSPVSLDLIVPTPSVGFGAMAITPGPVVLSLNVPTPTISFGAKTVTPDSVTLDLNVPDPTVQLGALAATPDPAMLSLNVPNPTVSIGALSITPDPAALALIAPDVSIGGLGGTTIAPDPAVLSLVVPSPSIGMVLMITPDPATLSLNVPDPTLAFGAIAITPDPAVVSLIAPDAWVGFAPITPDPVVLSLVLPDPTLAFTTLPDGYEIYVSVGNEVDLQDLSPPDQTVAAGVDSHQFTVNLPASSIVHVDVVATNAAGRSEVASGFYVMTDDAGAPILAPPPVQRLEVKALAGGKARVSFLYRQGEWLTPADHFLIKVTVIDAPSGSYVPVQITHTPPRERYVMDLGPFVDGLYSMDVESVATGGAKFDNVPAMLVKTDQTDPTVSDAVLSVVA